MNVAIKWEGENGVPEDEGKVRQRQTEVGSVLRNGVSLVSKKS